MTCPAENTLLRYAGGGLEGGEAQELEDHLDGCASCRFVYADLARGSAAATEGAPAIPLALPKGAPLARGTLVGRYVILDLLGRGGMGVVYKAFDPQLDRPIALKLVGLGGLGSDPEESRLRLLREAKTLAQLSHPNVVAVHDVGSYEQDLFVAMEFVAGVTLREWLREQPRTARDVLAVFRAAGAGLAAAHRLGIVHRDFKPENIMVDEEGRVRVLDFGLARSLERPIARPSMPSFVRAAVATATAIDSELTRDGIIVGTPAYMAPEQDLGHDVDARSDQFSFCAALYEALYRQRPFAGGTYADMAERRLAGDIRPPPNVPGVTAKVRRALLKGLRAEPAERHRSMGALLVELGAGRWASRTKLVIAALAITAAAAGGTAVWVATHAPPSVEESCAQAADDVKRVWNPSRRAELLTSITAAKVPDPAGMTERVATAIDRWTAEWSIRRTQLCEQTMRADRGEGEHPGELLACLRRRLTTLDASLSAVTHSGSVEVVTAAEAVIAGVESPSSCDARPATIVTDVTRERWKPLIESIVASRMAHANGRLDEAEQLGQAAVKTAKELGEPEALAAALIVLGQAQAARGEFEAARTTLLDSIRSSTAVHEDEMVVEAWGEIIGMAFRGYEKELEQAIYGGEVAAQRISPDHPNRAQLDFKIGSVRTMHGDYERGIPLLEHAIAIWTKIDPVKHRLDIAGVENTLGLIHAARGEWADAHRRLEAALAAWQSIGRPNANIGTTLGVLGDLHAVRHDYAKAEPLYRRALTSLEAAGVAGRTQLAEAKTRLGVLYAWTGRCAEAMPLLAQAREHATELHGASSSKVAMTMLGDAFCELASGRPAQAIPILERAKSIADVTPANLVQIPMTDFALARALTAVRKDRKRALELAERAREYLARYPGLATDRAEVEAWLAKHR